MSFTIELSDPVGTALRDEATRRGVPADELAETLLSERLPVQRGKGSLSALIQRSARQVFALGA